MELQRAENLPDMELERMSMQPLPGKHLYDLVPQELWGDFLSWAEWHGAQGLEQVPLSCFSLGVKELNVNYHIVDYGN